MSEWLLDHTLEPRPTPVRQRTGKLPTPPDSPPAGEMPRTWRFAVEFRVRCQVAHQRRLYGALSS